MGRTDVHAYSANSVRAARSRSPSPSSRRTTSGCVEQARDQAVAHLLDELALAVGQLARAGTAGPAPRRGALSAWSLRAWIAGTLPRAPGPTAAKRCLGVVEDALEPDARSALAQLVLGAAGDVVDRRVAGARAARAVSASRAGGERQVDDRLGARERARRGPRARAASARRSRARPRRRREGRVGPEGGGLAVRVEGEGGRPVAAAVGDEDARALAGRRRARTSRAMRPAPTTSTRRPRTGPVDGDDPVQRDVRERARRALAPRPRLAAEVERELEQPLEDRVEAGRAGVVAADVDRAAIGARDAAVREALAELVQDLVLADDDAVEPGGDREHVAGGSRARPAGGRPRAARAARRGPRSLGDVLRDVQLDPVAGAEQDRPRIPRPRRRRPRANASRSSLETVRAWVTSAMRPRSTSGSITMSGSRVTVRTRWTARVTAGRRRGGRRGRRPPSPAGWRGAGRRARRWRRR